MRDCFPSEVESINDWWTAKDKLKPEVIKQIKEEAAAEAEVDTGE